MNFRKRIITTFLVFAVAVASVFGVLLDNLMVFVEDEIIRDFLSENMSYFEEKIQKESTNDILISTPKLKAYLTQYDVPPKLATLHDGFHDSEDTHVLVRTLSSGFYAGEKLILLFDESKSFLDKNESQIFFGISVFSSIIVVLATIVCFYLAKSVASPIEYLARKVSAEQNGILNSAVLLRKDELGSLARAFSLSVERVKQSLEREKNFTRYASHELRTPLTVVKNNVDIIRVVTERVTATDPGKNGKFATTYTNSIARLDHAIWFMEQQINTLLLLARGEYQPEFSDVELSPLISNIETYFPDLRIRKNFDDELSLWADPTVLLSILTNIFNNVVEHGTDNSGKAEAFIETIESGFSVSNVIFSSSKDRHGKRFGLEIVGQLCDVMGWQFSLEETKRGNEIQFSIKVVCDKS